jgi:hypothetical protein
MLGGVAPILIFTFPQIPPPPPKGGIPVAAQSFFQSLAQNIGIPIPIYLDESVTGVYIASESKSLAIDTTPEKKYDETTKAEITYQRAIQNDVTIEMFAKRESILLSVFLAMNDIIFKKVIAESYNVAYINGPTVILNGLLQGFSSSTGNDDNLVRLSLHLSKAKDQTVQLLKSTLDIPKSTGSIPVGGG